MPAYFFDYSEDKNLCVDERGSELANDEEAQHEAFEAIIGVARTFPLLGKHLIGIVVRDAAGIPLYQTSITFSGQDLNRTSIDY